MYHFVAEQTAELRLSEQVLISSQTTRYLKSFQLDAVRFLYKRLSKQELCIFNDESGLGKSAAVAALLSGLGKGKKTLIVLQNVEQLLVGWQFHLGVLTDLSVCIINDINDSTESAHSVYLCKWSVLRAIGDLSKLNFDYVIVDHRGHTLNNNFCTSMLLNHFDRKVNIVISTVDVTADVKLLYHVLRLGGCLENQHCTLRNFERKYHVPDVEDVLSKRVDLEEYYKRRGVLGEYINKFRLRRYRHQFQSFLPLVSPEQYNSNLSLWLAEKNGITTLSGSTDTRSTGGTDEIFECLTNLKRKRATAQSEEPEKISLSEHSDEVIAMEPLVFEMSESEPEAELVGPHARSSVTDVVMLSSDDCEIVTPPRTPPQVPQATPTTKSKRKCSKRMQAAKLAELSESEAEQPPMPKPTFRKKLNVRLNRFVMPQKEEAPALGVKSLPKSTESQEKAASVAPPAQTTPLQVKLTRAKVRQMTQLDKAQQLKSPPKHEKPSPVTPKTDSRSKRSQRNVVSTELEPRQTRGMQRLTRSADSRPHSKYMAPLKALDFEKRVTPKRKRTCDADQTPRSSKQEKEVAVKQEIRVPHKNSSAAQATSKKSQAEPNNDENKNSAKLTPQLLSSGSGSVPSECSFMQCAQKLPENLSEVESLEFPQFRMPQTPLASTLLLPATLNLFSDSELAIVPSGQPPPDIVVVSSSLDESSQQSAKQSRRTRALKRKRIVRAKEPAQPSTSSFGQMLAQQRAAANKSPDIFSNCSDLSQLTLAQPLPAASPFEGFKIFGSEVKQLQQQHAKTQPPTQAKKKRDRSCLDILEQMFEPHKTNVADMGVQLLPTLPSPQKQLPMRRFTLLDEDIFEITNNGEFGSRLRLNSTGNVSPVQQQQQQQQRNKITNYLISSGGTPEDFSQRTQQSQALRKSPKSIKSTQSTKLTRWFGSSAGAGSGAAPGAASAESPSTPAEKSAQARAQRQAKVTRRRSLQVNGKESIQKT